METSHTRNAPGPNPVCNRCSPWLANWARRALRPDPRRRRSVATGTDAHEHPSAADGPSVVVEHLGKSFGGHRALRDVSFVVEPGEVVALLGPNGAGKTTTVNILSTLTTPDRGRARVAGYDVVSEAAAVRQSIMLTGQHVALDEMLTGRENLVLFGRLQDLRASEARTRADELLHEFDLVYAADRRLGTYSGGMRRRIDIACGLVVPPAVVFLDEPTTGLDPRSRQTIWDLVTQFKSRGIATLLTTQYLEEADALSDRIIVIDHGVVVAEGTANELKERTGGSYCEVVPRDPKDLETIAIALGPLLAGQNRAAPTPDSDRIIVPAPGGANTLLEAMSLLSATNVELADVALRRPSLDDVFLSLTGLPTGQGSGTPAGSDDVEAPALPTAAGSRRRPLRGAPLRRVLSPVLAGLLVGGVVAAMGMSDDADGRGTNPSTPSEPPTALGPTPSSVTSAVARASRGRTATRVSIPSSTAPTTTCSRSRTRSPSTADRRHASWRFGVTSATAMTPPASTRLRRCGPATRQNHSTIPSNYCAGWNCSAPTASRFPSRVTSHRPISPRCGRPARVWASTRPPTNRPTTPSTARLLTRSRSRAP